HLTDVAQLVGREDRLNRIFEALERRRGDDRLDATEMVRGENATSELFRDLDMLQSCMSNRAADEGDLLHARHSNVADVLPLPPQEPVILLAEDCGPDSPLCHCRRFRHAKSV